MNMGRYGAFGRVVSFGLIFLLAQASYANEKKTFALKEDLRIGADSGDENLIFGSVAAVGLDRRGRIYIWDYENARIQIFDAQARFLKSVFLRQGQGPQEVAMPAGVAVSPSGTIAVLDRGGNKVMELGADGAFLRLFKIDFQASDVGFLEGDRIILLGLNKGKILHLFDTNGRLLSSFGEPFEIPSHLSQFKDIPQFKFPLRFSCDPEGRIFVFNPHRFEISVYENAKLITRLPGKSELFEPAGVKRSSSQQVAMVFPLVTILRFGGRLYVTVKRPGTAGEGPNEMIIYENERRVGASSIAGIPKAIDRFGRIYCGEEEGFPRLIRYIVQEK